MRLVMMMMLVLATLACDGPAPSGEQSAGEAALGPADGGSAGATDVAAAPVPLSEPSERSTRVEMLTPRSRYAVQGGPESVTLRWSFEGEPTTFAWQEDGLVRIQEGGPIHRHGLTEGYLQVKPDGQGTADLVLELRGGETQFPSAPERAPEPSPTGTRVIPDLQPDGQLAPGSKLASPMQSFSLPGAALKRGQTHTEPDMLPFSVAGSMLEVGGEARWTYEGMAEIDGEPCAWVRVERRYDRLTIPAELGHEGSVVATVRAHLCFDARAGRLIFAESAARQTFSVRLAQAGGAPIFMDIDVFSRLEPAAEGVTVGQTAEDNAEGPALPERSEHVDALIPRERFPASPQSPERITPRWRFDEETTLRWKETTQMSLEAGQPAKMETEVTGSITVRPGSPDQAQLLVELGSGEQRFLGSDKAPQALPSQKRTLEGFGPRGRLEDRTVMSPLRTVALPEAPLKLGEAYEARETHPLRVAGSQLEVGGVARWTYEGMVEMGGTPCAWILVERRYDTLTIPEEAGHQGDFRGHTRAHVCFDLDAGRLIHAEAATRQAFWLRFAGRDATSYTDVDALMVLHAQGL